MVAHLDAMLERLATGEPLQYVLGQWSFRHIELAIDSAGADPTAGDRTRRGRGDREGRGVRSATYGRRPRHRIGRDRAVDGVRTARSTARRCGSPTRAPMHSTSLGRTSPGLGRAGRNVRVGHGSWFDALPADVDVRRHRVEPALHRDRFARGRRVGHRLGTGVARCSPATTVSTTSACWSTERASTFVRAAGWCSRSARTRVVRCRALLAAGGYVDVEIRPDLAGHDRIALARTPR